MPEVGDRGTTIVSPDFTVVTASGFNALTGCRKDGKSIGFLAPATGITGNRSCDEFKFSSACLSSASSFFKTSMALMITSSVASVVTFRNCATASGSSFITLVSVFFLRAH